MSNEVDKLTGVSGRRHQRRMAEQARQREARRQADIRTGMASIDDVFAGFNPSFYDALRQAQLDYLLPDIDQQYAQARDQLTFALARQGLGTSSVAGDRQADLAAERERAINRAREAGDQAAQGAQRDVEAERSSLVSQLQATADPGAAATGAASRAAYLRQPRPMADLGPLFQNVTAGLADMLAPTYDDYGRPSRAPGVRVAPVDQSGYRVVR